MTSHHFANAQDRNIGDLLKKLPGIEVDKDGSINFNGKPINRFYIEGMNLLDQKYGIAVNNVTVSDVKSVQVLRNHQPIRALEGKEFSQSAAININLQDDSKSKWLGTNNIAFGLQPILWKGEAMAMQMTKNKQSLNTLKSNNIGQDILSEQKTLTIDDLLNGTDNQTTDNAKINLQAPNLSIAKNRSMLNTTQVLNTNQLHAFQSGLQLRSNISLSNDKQLGESNTNTIYFIGNDSIKMMEWEKYVQHQKKAEGAFTLDINKKHTYINNRTHGQVYFNQFEQSTIGSISNNQKVKMPVHYIENDLRIVKPIGKHIVKISSFVHYASLPQSLGIRLDSSNQLLFQKDHETKFYLHNYIAYTTMLWKNSLEMRTGMKYNNNHYQNELSGFIPVIDSTNMHVKVAITQLYFHPKFTFKSNQWTAILQIPVDQYRYQYIHPKNKTYLYANPEMYLSVDIGGTWVISTNAAHQSKLNINTAPSVYTLRDYRSLTAGTSTPSINKVNSVGIMARYQHPTKGFFLNFSGLYKQQHNNFLSTNFFNNYVQKFSYFLYDNTQNAT